jgi:uncharacterized peroxidase-related enzyme
MEHHGAALHRLTKDEELVIHMKEDYTKAPVENKQIAMLDYSVKLTKEPNKVSDEDVAKLKNVGLTDREILDICQVTAYFNFVNRMAEGLGVELEPEYK